MEHSIRRLLALMPALALMAGLTLAARPATPSEDHSGVCVGSMQIVACVPPVACEAVGGYVSGAGVDLTLAEARS